MKYPLTNLVHRTKPPVPWTEGETIPWNDPGFSRRMLLEHLSQAHDAASRRFEIIDKHVAFIAGLLPEDRPARILDLGCGPGLYAQRLAGLGYEVTGIDFSPASIAYAREQAGNAGLTIRYDLQDLRNAEYGAGYDLAMLIFGEFNVFKPADARLILQKIYAALADCGRLVLEPHPFAAIRKTGEEPLGWFTAERGLFSEKPHLYLEESFWDADRAASTTRFYIVDLETGEVEQHSASMQAYTDEEYAALLAESGFKEIEFLPSLTGKEDGAQGDLCVVMGQK